MSTVLEALRGYLQVANGLTEVTRQRARTIAKSLVAQGGAAVDQVAPGQVKEQVQAIAEELIATSKANRDLLVGMVQSEVERTVSRLGLAQADDLARLARTVDRLERRLSVVEEKVAARPAAQAAAPRKSTAAKTAAKTTAAKASPTKASPTKAAGKKSTAKTTAAARSADGARTSPA
jgi:polyhydroxyalkanoate synthesis regulator phasin